MLYNEEQFNCASTHVQHYIKGKVMIAAKRPVQYWFSAFCQHKNYQCHSHIFDACIILIAKQDERQVRKWNGSYILLKILVVWSPSFPFVIYHLLLTTLCFKNLVQLYPFLSFCFFRGRGWFISPFVFEMGIKHTEILVFHESKNTYYIYTPLFKTSFLIYEIKF